MFRGFLALDDDVTCSRNDATVTLIFKFKFVKVVRRRNAERGRLYDQRIELIREFASDSSINDAQRTRSVLYAMREAEDEWFMSMYTDTETAYKYGDEHRLIQSHFGGDNVNYAALFEDFVDSEQEEYDSYVAAGLEHSVYEQMVAATPKTASASRRSLGSVPDYQISTPPLYRSRRDEGSGEGSGPLDVGNGTETPEGGNAILVPVVGSVAITSFSKGLTKYSTSTLKFKTVLEPPYAIDQTLDWTAEVSDHWDEGSTGQQPLPAAAVISPATCSGNITCVQTWTVDIDHAMACQLQGGYKFMDVYTRCQDNLPSNTECEAVNYFTFQINITDINVCEKTETFVDDVYSMAITADRNSIIYDDEMDYTLTLTELASLGQYMDAITIQSITSTADSCAPDVDIMPQTSIVHNPGALTATITIDFTSNVACADPGLGLTSMVTLDFVIDVDYSFNSARRRRQINGRNAAATGHLQINILINGRSSWGSELENEIELPAEEDESGTPTTYSPHQPITLALMVCATAVLLAR
ncbi:hypothetical protein SARC_04453 [Sphaeroforma arctica JP610]|uniref:Uncharacterized protein n=1 Tax=Sphaeroforma arctica JP610 TaxID=667725 RepID=A0A0L0G2D0_9EUKA|nr:hypothetical protein SARC_04453 [Sphaeroforma arctica JP610]KNC83292.1 hypothetical protein SARC_04453 [Sphaeroforma arctica JP610]|eukprot:XP_014157194.1 hypothetical protein SARC_04453 [Sphaeroforma arctica JP610]